MNAIDAMYSEWQAEDQAKMLELCGVLDARPAPPGSELDDAIRAAQELLRSIEARQDQAESENHGSAAQAKNDAYRLRLSISDAQMQRRRARARFVPASTDDGTSVWTR